MNLRSLEKANLRAASIRSKGSSESLILCFFLEHISFRSLSNMTQFLQMTERGTHAAKRSGRSK